MSIKKIFEMNGRISLFVEFAFYLTISILEVMIFYIDTCVWRDHYEKRSPESSRLFLKAINERILILVSDLTVKELKIAYSQQEIVNLLNILSFMKILKRVEIYHKDYLDAECISKQRRLPFPDVMHAIIARNNNAILITEDKHFQGLKDIVIIKRPIEMV
jgi:predicted nucleic acid-binding protein